MSEKTHIPFNSPEAASIKSVTGWVSASGFFFGQNEDAARYDGCTHRDCPTCGKEIPKQSYCHACSEAKEIATFHALPRKPWDGTGMLYSERFDEYTQDPEEFLSERNEGVDEEGELPVSLEDCRFRLCRRVWAYAPDPNRLYEDDLAEDDSVSPEIEALFDALQVGLEALNTSDRTLCFQPTNVAWNGEMEVAKP